MKIPELAFNPKTPVVRKRGHFRFNAISVLVVVVLLVFGAALEFGLSVNIDPVSLGYLIAASLIAVGLLFALPWWPMVIIVIGSLWAIPSVFGSSLPYLSALASLAFLIAPGFAIVPEWDKVVVLRLGRFHRVKGPGLLFLLPLIDTVAGIVDTRIRVTDFSAEKSLTLDTVPVHIDALAFWMIWDAEKAVLEVQDFHDAVVLSAQTALRSTIGSNSLTALLSERERLGAEIQSIVDAKTNPWGITIISVEFKEIIVPKELEDALSREAQAERERKARTILSSAEAEISALYGKAAESYRDDPTALQLRAMNMIYESVRNKGGLILTPASALESMNLGTALGAAAYGGATGATPDLVPKEGLVQGQDIGKTPLSEETEKKDKDTEQGSPDGAEGGKK